MTAPAAGYQCCRHCPDPGYCPPHPDPCPEPDYCPGQRPLEAHT